MNQENHQFWRKKLNAYFHDSPDKPVDIATHEFRAAWLKALDQFTDAEKFDKAADWAASAADRLPFPHYSKLRQPFEELEVLPHPLGQPTLEAPKFKSLEEAAENSSKTRPFLLNNKDARASYLCVWRFWRNWASSADSRFPFLPADTRIPDHSIWHHLSVTAAFQSCNIPQQKDADPKMVKIFCDRTTNPRLLLFSIGPVQDFIAAARSTRDLWSGSYLLAYLVSMALGKIARELGPDHVFSPISSTNLSSISSSRTSSKIIHFRANPFGPASTTMGIISPSSSPPPSPTASLRYSLQPLRVASRPKNTPLDLLNISEVPFVTSHRKSKKPSQSLTLPSIKIASTSKLIASSNSIGKPSPFPKVLRTSGIKQTNFSPRTTAGTSPPAPLLRPLKKWLKGNNANPNTTPLPPPAGASSTP